MVKMKMTSIQLSEDTRKKLEEKKIHPRESYDSLLKRMLAHENLPSMEEMFRRGDSIKQKKTYTTQEIIDLSHELREKR